MVLEVDWLQNSQGRLSHENVHHQSLDHKNSPFQGKMRCFNLPIISNIIHKTLKLGNSESKVPCGHACQTFITKCDEILIMKLGLGIVDNGLGL